MRFEDAVREYAVQLEADGRSIHTRNQYARHLRAFGAWLAGARPPATVDSVSTSEVAAFLASDQARNRAGGGPKRATSLNAMRSSLRTFFTFVHDAGLSPSNPARLVRRARCGTPPPRALSDDDRDRLLATLAAAAGPEARRDETLVRLLLGAGLRIGSAVGLDIGDVHLESSELALRRMKNDAPDAAFLSADLVVRLRGFIGDRRDGPLFATRSGSRLTTRQAARRFGEWVEAAKLSRRASPHGLRHTFATTLLRRTGDLALVQAALRHRSIASTLVYARVEPDRVRRAVATN